MVLIFLSLLVSLYVLFTIDLFSFSAKRSGWARFASSFLLFCGQIIITEFALGLFSLLGTLSLYALNIAISSAILIALKDRFGAALFNSYWSALRLRIQSLPKILKQDPLWTVLLAIALAFLAWILFLGIIFPSTDYDGNSYHLTFVADLIQNHNFFDVPTSLSWLDGYPKGGEFIQAWSVILAHNDIFSDLTQVPFLALGVYALYTIARRIGAAEREARFTALLYVFLPIVLNQLKTTYVDVMLCTVFFAGVALVIQKRLSELDYLLIGTVFSLLIAIKSTGALFVFALIPLLLWNLYQHYGQKASRYLKPLLFIVLPTLFGLYWYAKNFVLYGSPLYPFGITIAGHVIFHGLNLSTFVSDATQTTSLPKGCIQRIWFVWTEQKDWFGCLYNYDTNYAGLGPIWFIMLLPAALVSIYLAVKKRLALYGAVAASIIILFAVYPANYYSRYTMFITAVGILALSLVLTYVSKVGVIITKVTIIILACSVIATNFVLCNFPPGVVKLQLESVLAGSARGSVYAGFPGKAFVYIEDHVKPGQVVDYSSSPYFIYPLWRPDFANKVIFVAAKSKNTWLDALHRDHVRYFFATIGSKEDIWAHGTLKTVYKDSMYEIFETT